MNQDQVEKNVIYQDQVNQIAKMLFHCFYHQEEEVVEVVEVDSDDLLPIAEKIFQFFGTAEEAKKAIRFLHTVNPIKAKEIFDEL